MFGTFRHRREAALRVTKNVTIVMTICLALIIALSLIALRSNAAGGLATWYYIPNALTASGDTMTQEDWTAAHKTLPFGTIVTVCYVNGCARGVEITDRGPYGPGRVLDLNKIVADRIGLTYDGVGAVEWYVTCYACGDGYR